jgi:hypothetical protein
MTDQSDDQVAPADAGGENVIHNSVLIRTHEPTRTTHSWAGPAVLGLAVVIAGAIWGFMATHTSGPVVNHAVGASSTTIVPTSPG